MQTAIILKMFTCAYKLALHKIITGQLIYYIAYQFKAISAHGYHLLTSINFVM
jgi:hypothetical protein